MVCAAYIPASVKNYGLGSIPDVKFCRHFVPWTALLGLPYAAANVAVGMSAHGISTIDNLEGNSSTKMMMGVFAGVTLIGLSALGYFIKHQLQMQIELLSKDGDETDKDKDKAMYSSL